METKRDKGKRERKMEESEEEGNWVTNREEPSRERRGRIEGVRKEREREEGEREQEREGERDGVCVCVCVCGAAGYLCYTRVCVCVCVCVCAVRDIIQNT